jgi:hypothetical protein
MANRTIALDDVCEGIRMKMKENDPFFSFSLWIRSKMLEDYNKGQTNLAAFERSKVLVPTNYVCMHCRARGDHWTTQCPRGEEE